MDEIPLDSVRLPVWVWWFLVVSVFVSAADRFIPWFSRMVHGFRLLAIPYWKAKGEWPIRIVVWHWSETPEGDSARSTNLEIGMYPRFGKRMIGRIYLEWGEHRHNRVFPERIVDSSGTKIETGFLLDVPRIVVLKFTEPTLDEAPGSMRATAKKIYAEHGPNATQPDAHLIIEVDDDHQEFMKGMLRISTLGLTVHEDTRADAFPRKRQIRILPVIRKFWSGR